MRKLIALTACLFAMSAVGAQEHGASAPASAAAAHGAPASAEAPAHGSASASASAPAEPPKSIVPNIKPRLTPEQQRAKDEEAEAALNAKIAQRVTELRAQQAARIAAAAKAKKAAEAKKKEQERVAALPPPPPHGTHWDYEGEHGPANWSKINIDWAACNAGKRQSPIDIRDGMKVQLEQITFDYKPTTYNVLDNGHTIQVNMGGGNYITVGNRTYELVQFHFHRPSEERINGKSFEMVAHLVHRDAEGKLAVVAVLLERGKTLPVMQTVWNNLPLEKGDTVAPTTVLDAGEFLPSTHDYYTYMGSLTTPPCTEGVLWLVMKTPMQASPAQLALFARLYPLNARPIQASAGRVIKESN